MWFKNVEHFMPFGDVFCTRFSFCFHQFSLNDYKKQLFSLSLKHFSEYKLEMESFYD